MDKSYFIIEIKQKQGKEFASFIVDENTAIKIIVMAEQSQKEALHKMLMEGSEAI